MPSFLDIVQFIIIVKRTKLIKTEELLSLMTITRERQSYHSGRQAGGRGNSRAGK